MVNLLRVAQQDDFRTHPGTGDDPLGQLGRQVLRLVNDQIGFGNRPATDEVKGLGIHNASVEQLLYFSGKAALVGKPFLFILIYQELQIVDDRSEQRGDFFRFISRKEADVIVKLGVGAADQNAPVSRFLLFQHGVQADRQGVEGFGCAGHPLSITSGAPSASAIKASCKNFWPTFLGETP